MSGRVTIRALFLVILVAGVAFGLYFGYARWLADAHREAFIEAVKAGRVDAEDAKDFLSDAEIEQLLPPEAND